MSSSKAVHGLHEPDPAGGTQQGRDLTEGEVPDPDRDSFGEGCSLQGGIDLVRGTQVYPAGFAGDAVYPLFDSLST